MKYLRHLSWLIFSLALISCEELFEDTALNPIYYVECDINGDKYRAETNNNAWLSWVGIVQGEYIINSNISHQNKILNFNSFKSLGEGRIQVGTNVNSYLTDINYFWGDKDYSALKSGGSGYIEVDLLTDDQAEGTFKATLVNVKDGSDLLEITNGKFKVKTR